MSPSVSDSVEVHSPASGHFYGVFNTIRKTIPSLSGTLGLVVLVLSASAINTEESVSLRAATVRQAHTIGNTIPIGIKFRSTSLTALCTIKIRSSSPSRSPSSSLSASRDLCWCSHRYRRQKQIDQYRTMVVSQFQLLYHPTNHLHHYRH